MEDATEEETKLTPVQSPEATSRPKPTPPPKSKTESRWHLICTTLDDWINLAEWFKESTVRCEKALSKVIEEDFLPVLPEIIETRVSFVVLLEVAFLSPMFEHFLFLCLDSINGID